MLGPSANLLRRALAVLERDELRAFTHLSEALGRLRLVMDVDGERFRVIGGGRPRIEIDDASPAEVRVTTVRAAIVDLIDGETSFLDAVLARRIRITGDSFDLLQVARAQRAFTEGAVRARRLRPLLDELRSAPTAAPPRRRRQAG